MQGMALGQSKDGCGIVTCGDQTIYPGHSVQLSASGASTYTWSPAASLSATDIPNPIASPTVTTTYTVTGYPDLVVNGDFEDGYKDFETDYRYTSGNITATIQNEDGRIFTVDNQLTNHFPSQTISAIPWVTNGQSGKFMMVNGSRNSSHRVWQETISVIPHSNYDFSARLVHMRKQDSNTNYQANLKFDINGVSLGEQLAVFSWNEFTSPWNSEDATTATITIYDLNTKDDAGNDFGLDDISLEATELCTAEVTVNVSYVGQIIRPMPVCEGGSFSLTVPELFCQGCSGQWQIGPSAEGPFNTFTNNNIPASYNGYYLRYALEYPSGNWSYSNVVPVTVMSSLAVNVWVEGNAGCDGDPVTLHAAATTTGDIRLVSVGDILCTDGSIVPVSSWPVSGKTANGVVVHVDNNGWNGWALALDETENVIWNLTNTTVSGLVTTSNPREAIFDLDGYAHTHAIRRAGNAEQFPAAYLMDLSQGWYLPSIGQWRSIFADIAIINASMTTVGGTLLTVTPSKFYWSSTQVDNTNKWLFSDRAAVKGDNGTKSYRVRAMCSF
jgi:hypothetical protein